MAANPRRRQPCYPPLRASSLAGLPSGRWTIPAGIAALGRLGTRDVTPDHPRPPFPTRMSHVAHTPLCG